jgi:hypothetical protein
MPAGELADAVSGFVEIFERIGRRLDFDIEVSAGRPGAAAPGPRKRLFPEWAWTWDVWAAVAQAARRSGPTAAPIYAASVEARDLLLRSLEEDPNAWRRDRDRVFDLLAAIRASCRTPPAVDAVATRVAAPARVPVAVTLKTTATTEDMETQSRPTRDAEPARRCGRPRGLAREEEAAWWRDRAETLDEIVDRVASVDLRRLFDLLVEYGEVRLHDLGPQGRPRWWPKDDRGSPKQLIRFADRWKTEKAADTWVKYVQRVDNRSAPPRSPRHDERNVEPGLNARGNRPAPLDAASAAIKAIEDAANLVADLYAANGLQAAAEIRTKIRKALARGDMPDDWVDVVSSQAPTVMAEALEQRRRTIELHLEDVEARTKTNR